uniref:Nudix hydrolase domain-containing protein n=1 Tax=Romanomermis culicivorax TaxID=13658 RepID=A0A915K4Y0_ROMCU
MKVPWRYASTVILATPKDQNIPEVVPNLQILTVKRRADSRVMPGCHTFPGGALDEKADFKPRFAELYMTQILNFKESSNFGEFFRRRRRPQLIAPAFKFFEDKGSCMEIKTPADWAFKICALRELFEECGILIGWNLETKNLEIRTTADESTDSERLEQYRVLVHNDADQFLKVCQEMNILPAFWLLNEWSDWLTPSIFPEKMRFDGIFYLLALNITLPRNIKATLAELERAELRIQRYKIKCRLGLFYKLWESTLKLEASCFTRRDSENRWLDPKNALASNTRREIMLAPPQIYEMGRLAKFDSCFALEHFSSERDDLYADFDIRLSNIKPKVFDEPSSALRKKCKNIHRVEYSFSDDGRIRGEGKIYCNVEQPCGHISPMFIS